MSFFAIIFLVLVPLTVVRAGVDNEEAPDSDIVEYFREQGIHVPGIADLEPLISRASEHRLVLLGGGSQGTSEFHTWRAGISRWLIEEHGFDFVIIEGDWPLAYPVNLYVKHLNEEPTDSRKVLENFSRWPQWLWRNEEMLEFISWMHEHNRDLPESNRAGFYGLDIHAYEHAMADVIQFLEKVDPSAVEDVQQHYHCFERFDDHQAYVQFFRVNDAHCGEEMEAVSDLMDANRETYMAVDSIGFVGAYQSARSMIFFERYVRAEIRPEPHAWNHRVDHFHDVINGLFELYGEDARGIVWAHNIQVGDARATTMGKRNIGQIFREEFGEDQVYAVGLSTYRGYVSAGSSEGGARERLRVPNARPGSYERLMYQTGISPLLIMFDNPEEHQQLWDPPRGSRSIGEVYYPSQDFYQDYILGVIPRQFDAFIFFERTRELVPLE
ncbi:MAG: erythromycin esterase family protein [Balneolales bacterium]